MKFAVGCPGSELGFGPSIPAGAFVQAVGGIVPVSS